MIFEDDAAGPKSSSHGRNKYDIDLYIFHFLLSFPGLLNSFLAQVDIEVL